MDTKGWGIAGHQNSYSRGVAIRGWNEDRFGEELVSRRGGFAVDRFTAEPETKAAYVKPAKMDDKQVRSYPKGPPGAYVQPRDGMAGRLLFAHGMEAHDPSAGMEDHYVTMSQTLHTLKGVRPSEVVKPARPGSQVGLVAHAKRTEAMVDKRKKDTGPATRFETTAGSTLRLRAAGTRVMAHAGASTGGVDLTKSAARRGDFTRAFNTSHTHLRR